LIKVLEDIRTYFHLLYRQAKVIRKPASSTLPSIPDNSRICRRINKLIEEFLIITVLLHNYEN